MALTYHPARGSIVTVRFEPGFLPPEMVKRRLAIVLSPAIRSRPGLCTVVPLSTTPPEKQMPYHCTYTVPFEMPKGWGNIERWVKGDMVTTVGWHRIDLLSLGKDKAGRRRYQTEAIDTDSFTKIKRCVLHGLGFSPLTKHL
ncbi:type II toxin-antitoxin system PemK/MazF family toxin [Rhodobacteraceae bacterium CYK-10]|uniref:Type II toxin-antitoxin system PemK/MazF family toxin n=1 Tax=Stagnihabitans tardus TaxID=2699202 RepID=A0AAE5BUJ7_9RHOB|nr:type II toxin-antitoxin system PemK/MazF family toxin [Stagnihabitans tardus]NBZ86869.1 type II toxin-antitoxin system PemK/MazF family toxin [Stagnihabitans tardus]